MRWLGRVPYAAGLDLQVSLIESHREGHGTDTLLLLEHPPVITLGRAADPAHLLAGREQLARRGIDLFDVGRGGDVTYHGPGQLVGYPILALGPAERDAHRYLRLLEEGLIRVAAGYGVAAERVPGLTGIWVGREKLAAIGVRLSTGWITSHGFALNVSCDLADFSLIVPCGIEGRGVTSLQRLLGTAPPLEQAAARAARELAAVLGRSTVLPLEPTERLELS